jgi:hypothetical protein
VQLFCSTRSVSRRPDHVAHQERDFIIIMAVVSGHRTLLIASLILGLSFFQRTFTIVAREGHQPDELNQPKIEAQAAVDSRTNDNAVSTSLASVLSREATASSSTPLSQEVIIPSDSSNACGIPHNYLLAFDPALPRNYVANAKTVIRLGTSTAFGRFNNQVLQVMHALDFMYDRHGELETPGDRNSTAILVVARWVEDFFHNILGDGWQEIVGKNLPIVKGGESERGKWRGYAQPYHFSSSKIYFYRTKVHFETPLDIIMQRRRRLLGTIFGLPNQCNLLQRLLKERLGGSSDYVAIHIRTLEGGCTSVVPPPYERECLMNPEYIRSILAASNAAKLPIVVLSDMQNTSLITRLQQEFGKQVIVPAWEFAETNYTVIDDMMVAAKSKVFVGTRVSSMAIIIAQLRVLLYGHDPLSNYVYVYPANDTHPEPIVCKHCAFICSKEQRNDKLCGLNGLIA